MYQMIVIDDEDEIRNGICNYFPWEEIGFEVAGDFGKSAQALAFLSHHDTDVILTDIRMPGINGIELIEAIRGKGFDKPIVVLSGYADFTYAKQVMAFGVKHYIVKPARFAEIKKVFGLVKEELDERYAREGKESLPSLPAEKAPGIAEACRAYIKENYRTASLQSIADHVHMNPSYLSTCFHQQTGSKLYDYLAEMRMQEAAKLLVTTDKSIQEISEEVGYKVANSFARIFRQHYDISPSQYRLLHR